MRKTTNRHRRPKAFFPVLLQCENSTTRKSKRPSAGHCTSLWDDLSKDSIDAVVSSPQLLNSRCAQTREIVTTACADGRSPNWFMTGRGWYGTDIRFTENAAVWLKNVSSLFSKPGNSTARLIHQPATLDELEYAKKLPGIHALDPSRLWRAGRTPEAAYRGVSTCAFPGKQRSLLIDRSRPTDPAKRREWGNHLRRVLWSALAGGASLIVSPNNHTTVVLRREMAKAQVFLDQLPAVKRSWDPSEAPSRFLKRGRYHIYTLGPGEFWLYGPYGGGLTLDCRYLKLPTVLRWFDPAAGSFHRNDISLWGRELKLKSPVRGDAAIHLRSA